LAQAILAQAPQRSARFGLAHFFVVDAP